MKANYKIGLVLWASYVILGSFVAYTMVNTQEVASIATYARDSTRLILQDTTYLQCNFNKDCGNGTCFDDNGEKYCKCNGNYISVDGVCNYHQIDKLTMFLVSFFVGFLGVDWFLAIVPGSVHFSAYAAAGFFKLITFGGVGIWWLIDWILILCNKFPDSAEQPLGTANWQT